MSTRRKNTKSIPSLQLTESDSHEEIVGLIPLQIIRTETVISRMPIHNLVKGREINIQISKKNEQGKVTLHWEVSPSIRFGHPGQLAYKIDTVIINRIIDEIGYPVPRLIKIGTLNQLCQELGSQKAELKKSLQQNAATTISAKLHYKSNDGQERKLEATFARYSVVFTGETLPNGERADEIYVIFNDPYLEVLNSAPIRPLNYEYLKHLTPTSQRFYEIISYKVYAAIKFHYPQAKLLYSEYCTYSAQHRHDDFERVRVQMYRVHKPHLESSYITKVQYEERPDEEGKPDWIIYYTPGPRAKVEFQTFNSRQSVAAQLKSDSLAPARIPVNELQRHDQSAGDESRTNPTEIGLVVKIEETEAEKLVRYFHQLFFGSGNARPRKREVEQASHLINAHGFETAKAVIDCAKREAPKTNFEIKTFGGVMQYEAEALSSLEKARELEERLRSTRERQEREVAEDFYFQYFAPQYLARLKEDLSHIERSRPEEYEAFSTHFDERHSKRFQMIASDDLRERFQLRVATEFFNDIRPDVGVRVMTFAEWDLSENEARQDPIAWMNSNLDVIDQLLNDIAPNSEGIA